MKKAIVFLTLALMGCAQSPAVQHARHYAYNVSGTSNGNMVAARGRMAQDNLKTFERFYQQGKDDRAAGRPSQAEGVYEAGLKSVVNDIYVNNPSAATTETQAAAKDAKLFAESLRDCYLDGYNGK